MANLNLRAGVLFIVAAMLPATAAFADGTCRSHAKLTPGAESRIRSILRYTIHDSEYVRSIPWKSQMTYLKFCQMAGQTGHTFAVSQDVGSTLEASHLPVDGLAFAKTCGQIQAQPNLNFEQAFINRIALACAN